MEEDAMKEVEKIMGGMKCIKDFKCHQSGFKQMGKVKCHKPMRLVECLSGDAALCNFSVPFGNSHFCKCPLRRYVAEKLGK